MSAHYERWDIPIFAATSRNAGTYTQTGPSLRMLYEPSAGWSATEPRRFSGAGGFHGRICMMISAGAGTAQATFRGLVPGQDGTQAYHWRSLWTTGVVTGTGAYDAPFDGGPIPSTWDVQLVVASAAVTAGVWVELGG